MIPFSQRDSLKNNIRPCRQPTAKHAPRAKILELKIPAPPAARWRKKKAHLRYAVPFRCNPYLHTCCTREPQSSGVRVRLARAIHQLAGSLARASPRPEKTALLARRPVSYTRRGRCTYVRMCMGTEPLAVASLMRSSSL